MFNAAGTLTQFQKEDGSLMRDFAGKTQTQPASVGANTMHMIR
jgi:hypothetical protein